MASPAMNRMLPRLLPSRAIKAGGIPSRRGVASHPSFTLRNYSSSSSGPPLTTRTTTLVLPILPPAVARPGQATTTTTTAAAARYSTTSSSPSFSSSSSSSPPPAAPQSRDDDDMAAAEGEPTGLIADKGIELLTFGTPNGYKASILLEELKEAYPGQRDYTWQAVDIMKNTQKAPWFTALGPNGRIPVVVDHDRGGYAVMEGLAILGYLTRRYDPEHKLGFAPDSADYDDCEQWMAWQHGGLGPMQGQANHMFRFAKEPNPYGAQRYVGETERLYGVLDARLAERDYVAGAGRGRFSIADISLLGWVDMAVFSGVDLEAMFPHVTAWLARCRARPAVQRGFAVPRESPFANHRVLAARRDDPEARAKADADARYLREAKERYGYKYASP